MNANPNITNICDECDYCPDFCDGDVLMCIKAVNHGFNSEIGRESGKFEETALHEEFRL